MAVSLHCHVLGPGWPYPVSCHLILLLSLPKSLSHLWKLSSIHSIQTSRKKSFWLLFHCFLGSKGLSKGPTPFRPPRHWAEVLPSHLISSSRAEEHFSGSVFQVQPDMKLSTDFWSQVCNISWEMITVSSLLEDLKGCKGSTWEDRGAFDAFLKTAPMSTPCLLPSIVDRERTGRDFVLSRDC